MPRRRMWKHTVANGLRVVAQRLDVVGVVGVSVHYGVGFRSEPVGRSGFAHLFEHLMFQGSARVAVGDHFRYVQAAGGMANGATFQDYTEYHQVVPTQALERVLFLEADRMAAPRLTEDTLRTQTAVVKEEIRQNVLGRAYGGFPWTVLPAVLYTDYSNAHNGYGDFANLDAATLPEFEEFFRRYYAPGNAVVTVCGDVNAERAVALVDRWFAEVPAGSAVAEPDLAEALPDRPRWGTHGDPHARVGATAVGYRLPDPRRQLPDYLAHVALGQVLTGQETSRLRRRLVHEERAATDISTSCGLFGPLRARDPDTFVCIATHPAGVDRRVAEDRILAALAEELTKLAEAGPSEDEVARTTALTAAGAWQALDDVVGRTRALGGYELLFGRPELVDGVASGLARIGAADIAAAARELRAGHPAVVSLLPLARDVPITAGHRERHAPTSTQADMSAPVTPQRPQRPQPIDWPVAHHPLALPTVGPVPQLAPLPLVDTTLPSGLRVVASRLRSTPMAEVRLAIRLAPTSFHLGATHEILATTLLRGTRHRSPAEIVAGLAEQGATLAAARGARWLTLAASTPAEHLPAVLAVLAEVVREASHADATVALAAARARDQAIAARQQPRLVATEALLRELYGELPELQDVPIAATLAAVTGADVRRAHAESLGPDRATLIVVGDIDLDATVAATVAALADWAPLGASLPSTPRLTMPAPRTAWLPRPGAIQSCVRLVTPGLPRTHPRYVPLTLANVVFGGSFSSRLVTELRERRGLAYRCESAFRDHLDQMVIAVDVDTAVESAVDTMRRLRALMREMTERPPTPAEMDAARRYAIGMTALGMSSQRAWAANLLVAVCLGQCPADLDRFREGLVSVEPGEVVEAAATHYDPDTYRGVVLTAPTHRDSEVDTSHG